MDTILVITLCILGAAFLFFVINTIRCYLTRPSTDEETPTPEYRDLMEM
jgi:hypothetical protein